jgi:DNA-binding XRE family transcriptional regulator
MKKWSQIKGRKLTAPQIEQVRAEASEELLSLTLRQLREEAGRTQVEMAELARMTQSALSRLERRSDNPLEALRRYVEALGGEVEVVAVMGNKRVKLLGV